MRRRLPFPWGLCLIAVILFLAGKALAVAMLWASPALTVLMAVGIFCANGMAASLVSRMPPRTIPGVSAWLALAQVLPFVPDGWATLRLSGTGTAVALLSGALFFSLWVFLVALWRLPFLGALSLWGRARGHRCGLSWIFCALAAVLLPAADLALLALFPLFWWASFGAPVPLAPERPAGRAAHVFLIDPQISHEIRAMIFSEGPQGMERLGRIVGRAVAAAGEVGAEVTLLLPETTMFVEPPLIEAFLREIAMELGAVSGMEDWRIVWGAQWDDRNVVLWGRWNGLRQKTDWGVIRPKGADGRVPFFERRVLGFSFRSTEDVTEFPDRAPGVSASFPRNSLPFLLPESLSICYEALVPSGWEFGKPRVVLTNHSLFSRFRLLSLVYDANLRLLGTLFSSPLVLVGNLGQSGFFSWNGQSPSSVRVLRLEGFDASL